MVFRWAHMSTILMMYTYANELKIKDKLYLHIQVNIDNIPQVVHLLDGTHRSDEPVSKLIIKAWPGVPIVISPTKYVYLKNYQYGYSNFKSAIDKQGGTLM
jgi:hypothetical protein